MRALGAPESGSYYEILTNSVLECHCTLRWGNILFRSKLGYVRSQIKMEYDRG